jgi:hypothetical protein
MAGSLDDKATLVLCPGDYLFVVVGAEGVGDSRIYRNPFVSPKQVAAGLRRMADALDTVPNE